MLHRFATRGLWHHARIVLALFGLAVLASVAGLLAAVEIWPAIGAQGSDALREIIGDQAVAQLETLLFRAQDGVMQREYQLGAAQPAAPWAVPEGAPSTPDGGATATPGAPAATAGNLAPRAAAPYLAPAQPSAPAYVWQLNSAPPLGPMRGEGQWTPYISDRQGHTVAERTFLQPDPQRPYVVTAIVAFDATNTRLHFVLGTGEPQSSVVIARPGRIPDSDRKPGFLLADFNGGFKARHGHFGAMVNGVVVLPPQDGLGTVGIYQDGTVRVGAWGTDITPSPQLIAWRQNGPLIVDRGAINPHTADYSPADWGYTVGDVISTWRSALGMSADGRTLFYAAGPGLTVPALARAMADAGASEAIQLDINNYWVHFDAMRAAPSGPLAQPLLDRMSYDSSRYLNGFSRDFFYVTAANAG